MTTTPLPQNQKNSLIMWTRAIRTPSRLTVARLLFASVSAPLLFAPYRAEAGSSFDGDITSLACQFKKTGVIIFQNGSSRSAELGSDEESITIDRKRNILRFRTTEPPLVITNDTYSVHDPHYGVGTLSLSINRFTGAFEVLIEQKPEGNIYTRTYKGSCVKAGVKKF
jgi:hypothetical protein